MTELQKKELNEYLTEARYMSGTEAFREDSVVIRDFIDRYGDDLSWENIEKLCNSRRLTDGNKDRSRRFLYRWKMWKEGVPMRTILDNYVSQCNLLRACNIISCPDRDEYGFCVKRYKLRSSCPTLKNLDIMASLPEAKKPEKKVPEKVDWLFNKICSYQDAGCAVYKGNI